MGNDSQSAKDQKTSISPMLSVRHGAKAVEFYKAAFGAGESFRLDAEDGSVVARLSVGESEFWVADESARHPAKTAPYGNPALRSTRISAPGRWVYFGSWEIQMPFSNAPSKQEPPWFGPSRTRNMVGASDELSIPSDTTGKSASLWPAASTVNQTACREMKINCGSVPRSGWLTSRRTCSGITTYLDVWLARRPTLRSRCLVPLRKLRDPA